jgi:hypothetical protein
MLLTPGTIKYQDKSVSLPGFKGVEGDRLVSDSQGGIRFTSILPSDMDVGTFALTVNIPRIFLASVDLTFRGATLSSPMSSAVPNQNVSLIGTGFTGTGRSERVGSAFLDSVTLDGKILRPPHVSNLIELDGEGNFFTTITIPLYHSASAGSDLTLKVTDSGGRTGVMEMSIAIPTFYVTPDTSYPGQRVELVGEGFVATNASLDLYNKIDVAYWAGFKTGKINEAKALALLAQAGHPDGFTGRYSVVKNQNPIMLEALKLMGVSPDDYVAIKTFQETYITVDGEATFGAYFQPNSVSNGLVSEVGDFRLSFTIPPISDIPSYNEIHVAQTMGDEITVGYLIPKPSLASSPIKVFPGDQVEIQLDGLHGNYYLTPGALRIGGLTLALPGHFGLPGEKPQTGLSGSVTVDVTVPKLSPGPKPVIFTGAGGMKLSGNVIVLQGALQSIPSEVVPGRTIFVRSKGLSPAQEGRSWRRITGTGNSVIKINGVSMGRRYVTYPISIGQDGQSFFPVTLPSDLSSVPLSGVSISATDNAGRISSGVLAIKKPSLVVSPDNSLKGSKVLVKGRDFVANRCSVGRCFKIDITYSGYKVKTVYPDLYGNFQVEITVPFDAKPGMSHQIMSKVKLLEIEAGAVHAIPPAELNVTPDTVKPGERIVISGSGFPNNDSVRTVYIGGGRVISPLAATDSVGNFSIAVFVPENISKGKHALIVGTSYFASRTTFDVIVD